jgi:pyrroloquinoline-quinone synthase
MIFLTQLNAALDNYHLLKHPFYEHLWNCGLLKNSTLQTYATEYYHHVAAFPRYISAIHSRCAALADRQVLLGNLIEEEQGSENHPELWARFAEGLGVQREMLTEPAQYSATQKLVDGYFALTDMGYAEGLGALYAYERQTPAVAKSKIAGLKEFYNVSDEKSLQFFTVHQAADEWHSDECAQLIEKLDHEGQKRAEFGALQGAKLLWGFLDQMVVVNETCA